MTERAWQLSVEAEEREDLRSLQEAMMKLVDGEEELLARGVQDPDRMLRYGEGTLEERFIDDLHESGMVEKLSILERAQLGRTLNIADEQYWAYGEHMDTDGLYAATTPALTVATQDIDLYVLSGLVGYDLLGRSKKFDKEIARRDGPLLETCILLGGLALTIYARHWQCFAPYRGEVQEGIQSTTHIGGTLHGDFYISRGSQFLHDVVDPLGVKRPFGPEIARVGTGAYHSSEPGILAAVLLHVASLSDKNGLRDFHHKVLQRVKDISFRSGGNFADYGDGDGRYEAESLSEALSERATRLDHVLGDFIVQAGNTDLWLQLISTDEGILFRRQIKGDDAESRNVFIIPNNELEDFVVTFFENNFGRTSTSALAKVIDFIK